MKQKTKSEEVTGLRPLWAGPNGQKKTIEGWQTMLFNAYLPTEPDKPDWQAEELAFADYQHDCDNDRFETMEY